VIWELDLFPYLLRKKIPIGVKSLPRRTLKMGSFALKEGTLPLARTRGPMRSRRPEQKKDDAGFWNSAQTRVRGRRWWAPRDQDFAGSVLMSILDSGRLQTPRLRTVSCRNQR